jgi:hypothetical protein
MRCEARIDHRRCGTETGNIASDGSPEGRGLIPRLAAISSSTTIFGVLIRDFPLRAGVTQA